MSDIDYEKEAIVHGSAAAAARHHGIAERTYRNRLYAQREQASEDAGGFESPSPAPAPDERSRIRELERLVELQQQRIENLAKKPAYKMPTATGPRAGKSHARVIIPDTHGCFADDKALAALLFDLEQLAPITREIVLLGDHLDIGGFLSAHGMGYVAEAAYSYEDDVEATNQLLDRLQELCPKSDKHYLEGNHERRVERWCLSQACGNPKDAEYLHKLFGVDQVLHIDQRGINLYKQGQFYHNLPIPATIKLGRCHFTHGSRTGANPAKAMLSDFGGNVVFGHVHRMDSYMLRTVSEGNIGAWCPGCLCRLQPLWNHTQITGWCHGYGLQFVNDDGDFLHINVPIIDGKSYMVPLAQLVA